MYHLIYKITVDWILFFLFTLSIMILNTVINCWLNFIFFIIILLFYIKNADLQYYDHLYLS